MGTQNCSGAHCSQNNAAGGNTGTHISISQNCQTAACVQNNIGRRKREIAKAVLALTEDTLKAEKKEIQKREADALTITQNCAGGQCGQNNVVGGNAGAGTSISQNCQTAACVQNNILGRRKREIVDAINSLTEEVLEAEKQKIQKKAGGYGRRKREVVAKLLEEAHKIAEEEAEAELSETQSRKKRSFTHLLP